MSPENPYQTPAAALVRAQEAERSAVPPSIVRRGLGWLARMLGLVFGLAGLLLAWQVGFGMMHAARYGRLFSQPSDALFFGVVVLAVGFLLYWGARLLLELPDLLDAAIKPRGWYALAVAYPLYFCGLSAYLMGESPRWRDEWRALLLFLAVAVVTSAMWAYAGWVSARERRRQAATAARVAL